MKKYKRNNPLNIRGSKGKPQEWHGQVGVENGFCVFEDEDWGFRAAFKCIKTYHRKGFNTIRKIINRWAPPSENPTENYIEFVCKWMESLGYDSYGVELECSPLDLANDMVVVDLITGMSRFESGIKVQTKHVKACLQRVGEIKCDDEPMLPSSVPFLW